jgi:transmembrane sensor
VTKKQFLEDLISDDSFVRYLKGTASANEKKQWDSWKKSDPYNKILFKQAEELFDYTGFEGRNVPDPHAELKKLEKTITRSSSPENYKPGRFEIGRRQRTGTIIRAAAALLIIGVLSIGFFLQQAQESEDIAENETAVYTSSEFKTSYGEKATLELTNGSQIILNANSHLSYSYRGSQEKGQVMDIFLNGEAWFDIVPFEGDGTGTYRIHTGHGVVEVLGTTFVIQTSQKLTRAVLEEGVIRLDIDKTKSTEYEEGIVLSPGQFVEFNQDTGRIELREVNTDLYTSWIRDVWVFDQTPLREIAERIESVFGVTVEITTLTLKEKTLSGSIGSKNLPLIKQGISEAFGEKVVQSEDVIIIGD